jgi:TIGR03009 family protein
MNNPIMKYSLFAAPFALVLLTGSWSNVSAQQTKPQRPGPPTAPATSPRPATTQPRPAQPGPAGQPVQGGRGPVQKASAQLPAEDDSRTEEQLSPELEKVLRDWEMKSSQIKSLNGTHVRTVYNLVFEEEKRSSGKFYLKTPDMGRIDLVGTKPKKDEKSLRVGKSGEPFRLEADHAEKWICTGQEIVAINDEDKTFQVMPLPKEAQGENIVNTPLPFLFGMKAEDAKRRYRIRMEKNTRDTVMLVIFPRLASDQETYVEAWVILEKTNYLPTAVKMFDPTGKLETVYRFESVKVNDRGGFGIFTESNPFHIDLKSKGYKMVLTQAEGSEPPKRQADPRQNSRLAPGAGSPNPPRSAAIPNRGN